MKDLIKKINKLANKSKTDGLTEEKKKKLKEHFYIIQLVVANKKCLSKRL